MKKVLHGFIALFIIACITVVAAFAWFHHWFNSPNSVVMPDISESPILLEVERGVHSRQLARQLEAEGFVAYEHLNYLAARLFLDSASLKAGTYEINPGDSPRDIWERVSQGDEYLFSITFVEGSEFRQWQRQMDDHPQIRATLSDKAVDEVMLHIAPNDEYISPEGLLFPSTYRFKSGIADVVLYRTAYQRMQALLNEQWHARRDNLPLNSPYEALILASVVEKETGAAHERDLVASVFVNRLRTGMRLQSDPTIIYGLGERYRGVIYRSDIREHTPYNTYRIDGLPPTPIAMPGEEAIKATLNPAPSDYYYFVSRNDGTHVFSRTLAEHNRAVQEFQRN